MECILATLYINWICFFCILSAFLPLTIVNFTSDYSAVDTHVANLTRFKHLQHVSGKRHIVHSALTLLVHISYGLPETMHKPQNEEPKYDQKQNGEEWSKKINSITHYNCSNKYVFFCSLFYLFAGFVLTCPIKQHGSGLTATIHSWDSSNPPKA